MSDDPEDLNSTNAENHNSRENSKDQPLQSDNGAKPYNEVLKSTPKNNVFNMVARPGCFTYGEYDIGAFIDTVFHSPIFEDEDILLWLAKAHKNVSTHTHLPISEEEFFDRLPQGDGPPLTLYMSMSTSKRNEAGELRNRIALFKRMHVLVLDDIGTKVDRDLFKERHAPSYMLQTSYGNYQYGYVLETPIDNHKHASALVQAIYGAGYSDNGGAMATKKVRLPGSVHGKPNSPNFNYRSTLEGELSTRQFTPEQLLAIFNIGRTWEELKRDAEEGHNHAALGPATRWNQDPKGFATATGYGDPVVDTLEKIGLLIDDGDIWLRIKCPWHEHHTDGKDDAAYSPIGCGDGKHKHHRKFKCFHNHGGVPKDTDDFLGWITEHTEDENAVNLPAYDPAAELVHHFVWQATGNVWDLTGQVPWPYPNKKAFDDTHVDPVPYWALKPNGELVKKKTTIAKCFHAHPQRVVVRGATSDPRTKECLIEDDEGQLHVNTFALPDYGIEDPDPIHFKRFEAFIHYLLPEKEEAENFLDFLAAKLQDPSFRGWGWVMVTKANGTGRGTLALMLNTLFDGRNCDKLPFKELLNPTAFNEWQKALIVTTNESHDAGAYSLHEAKRVSEQLKDYVDTTSDRISINPKYGVKLQNCVLATSHIIFSNNKVSLIKDDERRMYYVANPAVPAKPEYFVETRKWMDDVDEYRVPFWRDSVANTLLNRQVDMGKLNGPAPHTKLHSEVDSNAPNALALMIATFAQALETPFYPAHLATKAVLETALQYDLVDARNPAQLIRSELNVASVATAFSAKVDGNVRRVRYFLKPYSNDPLLRELQASVSKKNGKVPDKLKFDINSICRELDIAKLKGAIEAALKSEGYI